jgi:hypothetical protein
LGANFCNVGCFKDFSQIGSSRKAGFKTALFQWDGMSSLDLNGCFIYKNGGILFPAVPFHVNKTCAYSAL